MAANRRVRNVSVLWTMLLLLQQFHIVILLNIEQMKSNEILYQTRSLTNDGNEPKDISKRDTGVDNEILLAVQAAGEAVKAEVESWETMFENITCDVEEEEGIRRVWTETVFVLHLYLSSSVILSYMKSCEDVMRNQIRALSDTVGTSDAVELVNDAKEYILSDIKKTETDVDSESDEEIIIDPESKENERLKDVSYLLANNMAYVHEFSDVLLSFNSSTQRSVQGIEKQLDEAINSYYIAESTLDGEIARKKRSDNNLKAGTMHSKVPPLVKKSFSKSFQIKNSVTHKRYPFDDSKKQTIVAKVNRFRNDYFNTEPVARKGIPERIRRSIDTDTHSSIVFVKNELYPCKLLSYQMEHLVFVHYDELLLTTQMWIWSEGYLQNYETGLFLQKTDQNEFVLNSDSPQEKFILQNGTFFGYQQDPESLICVNDEDGTLQHCDVKAQRWEFISVETAQVSIASITCLFFIQSIDSCLVLTSVGTESNSLEMRYISADSVANQLWYKDFEYIRLARNHEYLGRKYGNEISLMNTRNDSIQRWYLVKNIMINFGDENTFLVPSVRQPYMESLNKNANISDPFYQTRFREIHEDGEQGCKIEDELFFITNDDVPCKILCAKEKVLDPPPALRFGIPVASFAAGFFAGLFSLFCLERDKAVMTSLGIGIVLAIIYTVVAEFTQFLFTDTVITYFDEYDYSDFQTCVWHQMSGTLENMHFKKLLQVEEVNSMNSIILSEDANQIWYLRKKSILRENMACGLTLAETVQDNSKSGMLAAVCSSEQVSYMKWNKILINNSTDFFREIKCLYFLKSTSDKTCGVITVRSDLRDSVTSILLPSPKYLVDQLWYVENNTMVNLKSENMSVSINNGSFESIPFQEDNMDFQNFFACEKGRFLIKTNSVPCKVLSVSDDGNLSFMDYDHGQLMNQLWSWDGKKLKNIGSDKYLSWTEKTNNSDNNFENLTMLDSSENMWTITTNKIVNIDGSCSISVERDKYNVSYVVCQKSTNFVSNWSFIYFDENFNFAEDVLCPFFIQDQSPPCGYLAGNRSTGRTFVGPMSRDLFQQQLWYKSGDVVIHLESGLPLSMTDAANFFLLTGDEDSTVSTANLMKENGHEYLSLSTEGNIQVIAGRIILFDSAINYEAEKSCPLYNRTFFFLKNSQEPCKVATSDSINDILIFGIFDESRFQEQLWYSEFDRIINLHSGKALRVSRASDGEYLVKLNELLFFDDLQTFKTDLSLGSGIKLTTRVNDTHTCSLEYVNNLGSVACIFSNNSQVTWTSINYVAALSNLNDIMCLFYIRSYIQPCEFIAGFDDGRLLVRPATEELIGNQVFYWKDQYIVHKATGLLFSGNADSMTINLQQENQIFYQKWSRNGNKIVSVENFDLYVEFSANDGHVLLKNKATLSIYSNWTILPLSYNFEDDGIYNPHCIEDSGDDLFPFFLLSSGETKLVLTSGKLGEEALFETFSSISIESQLWVFHNDHIVNLGTGLALMVDEDKDENKHDILMWHIYSYSHTQRWYVVNSQIYSQLSKKCYLNSASSEKSLTVNIDCNTASSNIQNVLFDNEGHYVSLVTSIFFIKNMHKPCELLTSLDNGLLKMRPVSEDLIENQMWFWREKGIINFKTNLALEHNRPNVSLQTVSVNANPNQEWVFENALLKPLQAMHFYLSVNPSSGNVGVSNAYSKLSYNYHGKWVFVARERGLNDPDLLHCDLLNNLKLYVIRSEHDDCPLLNAYGDDNVGFRDTSDDMSQSSFWMRRDQHVCSAENGKCLSARNNIRGAKLYTEERLAYERYQKWERSGQQIVSVDSQLKVTFTGSVVALYDNSYNSDNRQTWKWYTNEQIEDDDKLLRCTRCYNEKEETAAEVISYIPIFGWLYNIGRSIAYGIKNCPKVALAALRDGLIDIALDIIVVLSLGTASAFAYGVKTGIKLGFKLGVKAFTSAIKAMLKNAIRSLKKGIIKLIKGGLRSALKRQLSKMRLNIKKIVDGLKSIPHTLKTMSKASVSHFKSFIKKNIKALSLASVRTKSLWKKGIKANTLQLIKKLKKIPSALKGKLSKLGKGVKRKLKTSFDQLSDKAEAAIKKADNIKTLKKKLRCRRMDAACIAITDKDQLMALKKYEYKDYPDMTLPDNLRADMDNLINQLNEKNIKGQSAIVGLKKDGKFVKTESVDINTLRKEKANPLDHNNNPIIDDAATSVQHTEQHLFEKLKQDVIDKCGGQNKNGPCEVFLFTKLSPCYNRLPSEAKTCMKYMTETCKDWLINFAIKCNIGFQKFYGTDPFNKNWQEFLVSKIRKETPSTDLTKKLDDVFVNANDQIKLQEMLDTNFKKAVEDASEWFRNKDKNAADVLKMTGDDLSSFYNNLNDNILQLGIDVKKEKGLKDQIISKVADKWRSKLNILSKERTLYDAIDKIAGTANDAIRFSLV